jgi:hypothetical protein
MLADALLAPVLAGVAVVLLVAAVELEELLVLLAEVVGVPGQLVGERAAVVPAVSLDGFDGRRLGFGGAGGGLRGGG